MAMAKVLVVDDEEEFARTLSERMEARGLRVEIANSGAAALEKIKGRHFDAVVLDLAMPGMDGIETLQRMIAENADLQIILLTGHATVQKGVESIKLGAMDFLEKPIDFNELMGKIEEAERKSTALLQNRSRQEIDDLLKKKGW
jgi:DNA-binding NtrC family response regulator